MTHIETSCQKNRTINTKFAIDNVINRLLKFKDQHF